MRLYFVLDVYWEIVATFVNIHGILSAFYLLNMEIGMTIFQYRSMCRFLTAFLSLIIHANLLRQVKQINACNTKITFEMKNTVNIEIKTVQSVTKLCLNKISDILMSDYLTINIRL